MTPALNHDPWREEEFRGLCHSCCVRNATACRSVDLSWDKDGPEKISFV